MVHVLAVNHRVEGYEKWKAVFDADVEGRRRAGQRAWQVLRTLDDPSNLVVILQFETLEQAQEYLGSEDLRSHMAEAGVLGPPDVFILEELDCGTLD